jgi:hypothetical protein
MQNEQTNRPFIGDSLRLANGTNKIYTSDILKKNCWNSNCQLFWVTFGTRQTGSSASLQTHNKWTNKKLCMTHERSDTLWRNKTLFHPEILFKHLTAEVSPQKRNQVIIKRLVEWATF